MQRKALLNHRILKISDSDMIWKLCRNSRGGLLQKEKISGEIERKNKMGNQKFPVFDAVVPLDLHFTGYF